MRDETLVEPLSHKIDMISLKLEGLPFAGSSGGTAFLQISQQQFYIGSFERKFSDDGDGLSTSFFDANLRNSLWNSLLTEAFSSTFPAFRARFC